MTVTEQYTFGDGERVVLKQADLRLVARPAASPTNLAEAISFYAAHGLPVTPVKRGDKEGYKKGWSQPGYSSTSADFKLDDNIGVLNGTEPRPGWYFHDVDIDANSDAARLIVERLLPPTDMRYGRKSKPRSHAGYLVNVQLRTRKYKGVAGENILELRGVTQKKTHTLSVAPGSTHESGEDIRFCEPLGAIGRVDVPDDLDKGVQYAAAGIVICTAWPATRGSRHRLRLAFAKIIHAYDVPPDRNRAILEAVMEATGSDIHDVAPAVMSTVTAVRTGQPTEGASAILDVFGEELGRDVLARITKILRAAVDETTSIVMRGGQLSAIVDRAEAALLPGNPIYQRGGVLARAIKLDKPVGEGREVRRVAGSTVLIGVREAWLIEQMGKRLSWFKPNARGDHTRADPQPIYARTLLSRGEWRFAVLRGVVTAPTLGRDGRIIAEPGFDEASGLLLDFERGAFPQLPEAPTKHDAQAALALLMTPLRAFPFVDDAARSVALSAMLSALVRSSLRTAPLHGYDAPIAGTGKSLLAETAGLLAMGVRPPALSQGKNAEEDEKRLSTVLFAGDPVIHIDNCELPVTGDFLCSMLTQEIVQARILGLSERRVLPSTALVLASGNNLTFVGDTTRRVVVCRLDAGVERPDSRAFDFDCHAEVLAQRPELVVAGLTILRAYVVAGKPVTLIPMGSFPDYDWIRGALIWLGRADPADTRNTVLDADPRRDELVEVMAAWERALGSESVEVGDLAAAVEAYAANPEQVSRRERVTALHHKLIEVACRGAWNGKSVGWWLKRNMDRVVGGRCFRCESSRNGLRWRLVTQGVPVQGNFDGQ